MMVLAVTIPSAPIHGWSGHSHCIRTPDCLMDASGLRSYIGQCTTISSLCTPLPNRSEPYALLSSTNVDATTIAPDVVYCRALLVCRSIYLCLYTIYVSNEFIVVVSREITPVKSSSVEASRGKDDRDCGFGAAFCSIMLQNYRLRKGSLSLSRVCEQPVDVVALRYLARRSFLAFLACSSKKLRVSQPWLPPCPCPPSRHLRQRQQRLLQRRKTSSYRRDVWDIRVLQLLQR